MTKGIGKSGLAVQFCPLHAQADALREALERYVRDAEESVDYLSVPEIRQQVKRTRALLATIQKGA